MALITAHLKCRSHSDGDSVATDIYIFFPPQSPPLHPPPPPPRPPLSLPVPNKPYVFSGCLLSPPSFWHHQNVFGVMDRTPERSKFHVQVRKEMYWHKWIAIIFVTDCSYFCGMKFWWRIAGFFFFFFLWSDRNHHVDYFVTLWRVSSAKKKKKKGLFRITAARIDTNLSRMVLASMTSRAGAGHSSLWWFSAGMSTAGTGFCSAATRTADCDFVIVDVGNIYI